MLLTHAPLLQDREKTGEKWEDLQIKITVIIREAKTTHKQRKKKYKKDFFTASHQLAGVHPLPGELGLRTHNTCFARHRHKNVPSSSSFPWAFIAEYNIIRYGMIRVSSCSSCVSSQFPAHPPLAYPSMGCRTVQRKDLIMSTHCQRVHQ